MSNALTRLTIDVLYLDEIFRSKDFINFNKYKALNTFPIAELLETYSDSPNLRLVVINLNSDFMSVMDKDNKYKIVKEMIATFNDEATLIILQDLSIDYSELNMYPLKEDNTIYVYENAPGIYILDNMNNEEEENEE